MVILCFYKSCVNVFRLTARLLGRMFKGERLAEGLVCGFGGEGVFDYLCGDETSYAGMRHLLR